MTIETEVAWGEAILRENHAIIPLRVSEPECVHQFRGAIYEMGKKMKTWKGEREKRRKAERVGGKGQRGKVVTRKSQAGHSKLNTEMRNMPPSGVKMKEEKEKHAGSEDEGQFGPLGISYSREASLSWKPWLQGCCDSDHFLPALIQSAVMCHFPASKGKVSTSATRGQGWYWQKDFKRYRTKKKKSLSFNTGSVLCFATMNITSRAFPYFLSACVMSMNFAP